MLNVYTHRDENIIEYQISPKIPSGHGACLGYARKGDPSVCIPTIVVLTWLVCVEDQTALMPDMVTAMDYMVTKVRLALEDPVKHSAIRVIADTVYAQARIREAGIRDWERDVERALGVT
jgi:hypothetical protein